MSTDRQSESHADTTAPAQHGPVFFVLEKDALVSSDLIQALQARGPCRVLHVARPEEAKGALDGVGRVDAAFLAMGFDDAMQSGLTGALRQLGARMVLTMGEDSQRVLDHGWHLLLRPFTERMVHDMLSDG